MRMMTTQDVLDLVGENNFFGVTFTKKSTGEDRKMQARFGVTSNLKGGARAYNPDEKGLMWVTDMAAARTKPYGEKDVGRRSINLAGLKEIRAKGKKWKVENGQAIEVASTTI